MISNRLKNIFVISIPVFVGHGLEEYFKDFYNIDGIFNFMIGPLNAMSMPQATFLLFQIMLWILLVVSALLITSEKWQLRLMIIPGLVYVFELHHIWKAVQMWDYYPGLITALAFPVFAFVFWKELLKGLNLKN